MVSSVFYGKGSTMDEAASNVKRFFAPLAGLETESDVIRHRDAVFDFLSEKLSLYGFRRAETCLRLVTGLKTGALRDDGRTPSDLHEMTQALYTFFLKLANFPLPDLEDLVTLNIGHDLGEDFGLGRDDLKKYLDACCPEDPAANARTAAQIWGMTKKFRNRDLFQTENEHLANAMQDPVVVIARPTDRLHNLATAPAVMQGGRLQGYLHNTLTHYPRFIDEAHCRYPELSETLDRLGWLLQRQVSMIVQNSKYLQHDASLTERFNSPSRLIEADRYFPAGLSPLITPQERIAAAVRNHPHYDMALCGGMG